MIIKLGRILKDYYFKMILVKERVKLIAFILNRIIINHKVIYLSFIQY